MTRTAAAATSAQPAEAPGRLRSLVEPGEGIHANNATKLIESLDLLEASITALRIAALQKDVLGMRDAITQIGSRKRLAVGVARDYLYAVEATTP